MARGSTERSRLHLLLEPLRGTHRDPAILTLETVVSRNAVLFLECRRVLDPHLEHQAGSDLLVSFEMAPLHNVGVIDAAKEPKSVNVLQTVYVVVRGNRVSVHLLAFAVYPKRWFAGLRYKVDDSISCKYRRGDLCRRRRVDHLARMVRTSCRELPHGQRKPNRHARTPSQQETTRLRPSLAGFGPQSPQRQPQP